VEALAQRIPVDAGSKPFNFFVGALPGGKSTSEQAAPFCGGDQDAATAVRGVGHNLYKSATLERLRAAVRVVRTIASREATGPIGGGSGRLCTM
jgi:hypothetical protein